MWEGTRIYKWITHINCMWYHQHHRPLTLVDLWIAWGQQIAIWVCAQSWRLPITWLWTIASICHVNTIERGWFLMELCMLENRMTIFKLLDFCDLFWIAVMWPFNSLLFWSCDIYLLSYWSIVPRVYAYYYECLKYLHGKK